MPVRENKKIEPPKVPTALSCRSQPSAEAEVGRVNHAVRKKLLLLLLLRCLLLWGCLLLSSLLLWSSFLLRSFLLGHSSSSVKKSQLRIPSRGLTDELTALTKTKTTFNICDLSVRYNIPNVEQTNKEVV